MAIIARQAKALGLKGDMFAGGDGWDGPELLKDAGDELEGALFTNFYAPDVPWASAKEFRVNYNARFKHDPSSNAAMGYDAAKPARRRHRPRQGRDPRRHPSGHPGHQGLPGRHGRHHHGR